MIYNKGILWTKTKGVYKESAFINGQLVFPGELIEKIGTKGRASMDPGYPFRYEGKLEEDDRALLFKFPQHDGDEELEDWYFVIFQIDDEVLFIPNPQNRSGYDVRADKVIFSGGLNETI